MFNKVILATSVAVLISGSAMAADAIVYNEPAPVAATAVNTFSWEGAYIGVNAGYGFGKAKNDFIDVKPKGFIGGIQAGYNWQFGEVVAGIEADYQFSTMKKDYDAQIVGNNLVAGGSFKVQSFGTVRGRLGYNVAERTLLYGTAGLAYGKIKEENSKGSFSETRAGWTAGAGVEYAFTDNVTLKTEYLYTDLGKVNMTNVLDDETKINFHTVRVGVNYKF